MAGSPDPNYPDPKKLPECFARLQKVQLDASPETVLVYQDEVMLLAATLLTTIRAKNQALRDLKGLFQQHPDHFIFDSLPGAGQFLAPALLAKFGDDRQRFSTAAGLQALAGTCPVTDASALEYPPPLPFSEVRRVDPLENERVRRRFEAGTVELRQRVTESAGQIDRPRPPALRRGKPAPARIRLID